MVVSKSDIDDEHDRIVSRLKLIDGVSIKEDYGTHEENNELVPAGDPNEGGMWVREVRVSLNNVTLDEILNTLSSVSSDADPKTYIQDTNYEQGSAVTVRICCDENS